MTHFDEALARRRLLMIGLVGGVATAGGLAGCQKKEEEGGGDVSAPEDLMREHGILRRVLIAYEEVARRLTSGQGAVDPGALTDAANLFRRFGEDYHERSLEEAYVFPQLQKAGGEAARLVDTLRAQHTRGREITEYVLGVTRGGAIGASDAPMLASALQGMTRMYESHAAWEDTIIFPAWKAAISKHEMDEMTEKFEDLEHKQFGEDGFEDAVKRVAAIEQRLGLASLADMTAPPPPPTTAAPAPAG